jgi:hypothetical protein
MGAAVIMRDRVFKEEGLPVKVVGDRGPQFISGFMRELYKLLGVEGNPSTAYHLQTDGQTKRVNREVEKYLRMFTNHRQDNWADWLPLAEFVFNNAVHETMGQTPFFLNKGRHPRMLPTDPVTNTSMAGTYLQELQKVMEKAEESLRKAKQAMKKRWDSNKRSRVEYEEGDLVLIQADYLPSTRPSRKLDDKWRGPFKILQKKGNTAYEIELPSSWKGHNIFNEARIKRFTEPIFPGQPRKAQRPDPVLTNTGREEYEVEEILDDRERNNKKEYLVRWKDYRPEDDTWESQENLKNAPRVRRQYESRGQASGESGYHITN